jgi:hypothetical protein
VTAEADQALAQDPGNYTNFVNNGGYSIFDGPAYDDETGQPFTSWKDYFGPVEFYGDKFTHLVRYNLSDPNFDEYDSNYGFVVSGYGDDTNVPPQPFKSENIVLLSNGECSSTCTTFSHLLKWQGKVKSIMVGGRPQEGPMQYIGGVKGKQVYTLSGIVDITSQFYSLASQDLINAADQTGLKTIQQLGQYVINRCITPSQAAQISVNIQNSIAEGDSTFTPLQFVYEAADCRLWWTQEMIFNINALWKAAADQAFGTTPYSGCVAGSTNQPSSLSGNATLYNNGTPVNVTRFVPEPSSIPTSSTPTGTSSGGPSSSSTAKGEASVLYGCSRTVMVLVMAGTVLGHFVM